MIVRTIAAFVFLLVSFSANSLTASGTVKGVQISSPDNITAYFWLDPMPEGVTQAFYMRSGSGATAGCEITLDEKTLDRSYSALLMAKASGNEIAIDYCLDSNGYGLINGYFQIK